MYELKRFSLTVGGWQGYGLDLQFGNKGANGRRKNAAEMVQLPDVPLEMAEAAMRDTFAQVRLYGTSRAVLYYDEQIDTCRWRWG